MSEQIRILTSSSITINRIAAILDENNIPALIKNNNGSASIAGFGAPQNDVDLFVNESDFENAKSLIEAFLESE